MTDKHSGGYWIADPTGVKARVHGADARDLWTKVHGWSETTEPTGQDMQWVRHTEHGGKGVLNHEAALLHEGLGWVPSGPEGYDEPDSEPDTKPKKSSKPAATASGNAEE